MALKRYNEKDGRTWSQGNTTNALLRDGYAVWRGSPDNRRTEDPNELNKAYDEKYSQCYPLQR